LDSWRGGLLEVNSVAAWTTQFADLVNSSATQGGLTKGALGLAFFSEMPRIERYLDIEGSFAWQTLLPRLVEFPELETEIARAQAAILSLDDDWDGAGSARIGA